MNNVTGYVQLLNIVRPMLSKLCIAIDNNCTPTNGKIYTGYAITYIMDEKIMIC